MIHNKAFMLACAWIAVVPITASRGSIAAAPTFQVRLDSGHPWRPPFGLDRVGRPTAVVVEASGEPETAQYVLTAFFKGEEIDRYAVDFTSAAPYYSRVTIKGVPDELVLSIVGKAGDIPIELARQKIHVPELEADAIAAPDGVINPVDLGTILVPAGWLLLGPEQGASLEFAAISRTRDVPQARLKTSFKSVPATVVTSAVPLRAGVRTRLDLKLPPAPPTEERDFLAVILDDGAGNVLWRKEIPVMLVHNPPPRPRFGATYERLRYDAPISVREPGTGKFSGMTYADAWKPELRDVVVWLPNQTRFVFWRGSSYIPFWAGLHNTGACYEWAEIISQPQGAVDCVEPLMDKELRYSRVRIASSRPGSASMSAGVISQPISTTKCGGTRPSRITTSIPTAWVRASSASRPIPKTITS